MIAFDLFGVLPKQISPEIKILAVRHHSKASEAYVDVEFTFAKGKKTNVSIPVNYRRTGLDAQWVTRLQRIPNAFARIAVATGLT